MPVASPPTGPRRSGWLRVGADPTVPQFTVSLNTLDDNWSFGFDVSRLATAFCTTADALLEANRRGELTLDNVLADTPDEENASLKTYVFGLGGQTIRVNIERLTQMGRA